MANHLTLLLFATPGYQGLLLSVTENIGINNIYS